MYLLYKLSKTTVVQVVEFARDVKTIFLELPKWIWFLDEDEKYIKRCEVEKGRDERDKILSG